MVVSLFFFSFFFYSPEEYTRAAMDMCFFSFPLLFLDSLLSRKTQENFESEEGESHNDSVLCDITYVSVIYH